MKVTFSGLGGATAEDHLVVHGDSVTIVEVSGTGFEAPNASASAPIVEELRAAPEGDVVGAIAGALDDEEAAAWVVRVTVHAGEAQIAWLGGMEVHLVREGRAVASTRGHWLDAQGAPRVVTRGIGAGYRDAALDGPACWPVRAGDQLIAVSAALADAQPATVADAAHADDAAAVLASIAGTKRGGFVVLIEL